MVGLIYLDKVLGFLDLEFQSERVKSCLLVLEFSSTWKVPLPTLQVNTHSSPAPLQLVTKF